MGWGCCRDITLQLPYCSLLGPAIVPQVTVTLGYGMSLWELISWKYIMQSLPYPIATHVDWHGCLGERDWGLRDVWWVSNAAL